MSTHRVARRIAGLRRRALLPVVIAALALGGGAAGCSSTSATMTSASPPMAASSAGASPGAPTSTARPASNAAAPTVVAVAPVPLGSMTMPTADEATMTWQARPDFVRALPAEGQAAYSFALARPDVLQWMPCYCGCAGAGHRSNLDCFFQRREVKGSYAYEEHASYCNVCIKTANLAQRMLLEGSTVTQIRAAVDATFGGGAAPGTDTPLPPA
jgi:hypothetical protein